MLTLVHPVLAHLNEIAGEGLVLSRADGAVIPEDLHLAVMIGYFTAEPQMAAVLVDYAALSRWWAQLAKHLAYTATDPGLATFTAQA